MSFAPATVMPTYPAACAATGSITRSAHAAPLEVLTSMSLFVPIATVIGALERCALW
jgi:hypothetical protein